MKAKSCENCVFWDNSTQIGTMEESGACRAQPPVADDRTSHARWPFTEPEDWCGGFLKRPAEEPSIPRET